MFGMNLSLPKSGVRKKSFSMSTIPQIEQIDEPIISMKNMKNGKSSKNKKIPLVHKGGPETYPKPLRSYQSILVRLKP